MRKTCLQSVIWLLHLGYADWDHAVRVQYHLSTSNYCHQQEKAEQEEEEESKAKVHIHVEPAWGWKRRVHFDQSHKISLLPSCWSPSFRCVQSKVLFQSFPCNHEHSTNVLWSWMTQSNSLLLYLNSAVGFLCVLPSLFSFWTHCPHSLRKDGPVDKQSAIWHLCPPSIVNQGVWWQSGLSWGHLWISPWPAGQECQE